MQNKKVLIFSMKAGFGHLRAGDALLEYVESVLKMRADHIDIIDVYKPLALFSKCYEFVAKKLPAIWGLVYWASDNYLVSNLFKFFSTYNPFFRYKIKRYIKSKKPDIILFTNMAPIGVLLSSCKKMLLGKKIGVIVTDFHGHYYYKFKRIDYYFVAHEQIKKDLERIGIATEKIITSGIPINPRFYIQQDVKELKEKYGIKNNLPTILFIASFGIGPKEYLEAVKNILTSKKQVNLIFITNGSKKIYELMQKEFFMQDRLVLVNWTNMMEEYMKIANLVISKAGGLTVSECLSLSKKMIIVNPIAGQEEKNTEFLERNNFGRKANNVTHALQIANALLEDFDKLKSDTQNEQLINPSEKIFEILLGKKS